MIVTYLETDRGYEFFVARSEYLYSVLYHAVFVNECVWIVPGTLED
jgi:hypothetical protein